MRGPFAINFRSSFVPYAVALLGTVLVLLTSGRYGHSWDEALYYRGARHSAAWAAMLVYEPTQAFSQYAIEACWGTNFSGHDPLHPEVAPIPKIVTGLPALLFDEGENPMFAMRFPVALAFGLTLLLLGKFSRRHFHTAWPAMAYLLMPRVFGHAHFAASETLSALAVVLLLFAVLSDERRPFVYALRITLCFVLAFLTKITLAAFALPVIAGVLLMRRGSGFSALRWLPVMMLVFVGAVYALWPVLWFHPLATMQQYLDFYLNHQKTAVFYLGQKWGYRYGPTPPMHYAFVIIAVCIPAWQVLLLCWSAAAELLRKQCNRKMLVCMLFAATPIALTLVPDAPKYDGERLFFAAFAFLAIIIGVGLRRLISVCTAHVERTKRAHSRTMIAAGLCIIGLVPHVADTPFQPDYYNAFTGGRKGAQQLGFETTYWGQTITPEFCNRLNATLPENAVVLPFAFDYIALENLRDWGVLRHDLRFRLLPNEDRRSLAVYVLLQSRQGFWATTEQKLVFNAATIDTVTDRNGVDFFRLYPNAPTP